MKQGQGQNLLSRVVKMIEVSEIGDILLYLFD